MKIGTPADPVVVKAGVGAGAAITGTAAFGGDGVSCADAAPADRPASAAAAIVNLFIVGPLKS